MAPIQFGVLLIPFQLVDTAMPIDILSSCSKPYLAEMVAIGAPPHLSEYGIDIKFHHIGPTMSPVEHTASFKSTPSCTIADCPKLDYLLIGGPKPDYIMNLPEDVEKFIRERAKEVKILFTTCTGGMVAAKAGILDGLNATTNHGVVPIASQMFSAVKWTKEKQWVVDGKFWTSGGACAGMDMMASWVMENYGMEVAKAGFVALDYQPRDVNRKMVDLGEGLNGHLKC